MSRVVAYDLPIGYCWHSWDKAGLEELRRQADWLESDDYYFSGKLTVPPIPPAIKQDVAEDAEQRKAEKRPGYVMCETNTWKVIWKKCGSTQ